LDEDEARTALSAAGMSDADMPPLEDRSHNAWKQERIGSGERGRAGKEEDSEKVLNASSLLRGKKLTKLHVKNKEMQPCSSTCYQYYREPQSNCICKQRVA
jgi:hypothetical protein